MERENEYENPGGNYPDEGGSTTAAPPSPAADDPAAADPAVDDPAVDDSAADDSAADDPAAAPADDSAAAPAESAPAESAPANDKVAAEQVAPESEPSHQAVGIGVPVDGAQSDGAQSDGAQSDGAQSGDVQEAGVRDRDGGGAATVAESVASTDHHGQDGRRETLTVGEAQNTAGALGSEQQQRLPAMAQNNASDVEKAAGIVAQTRGDLGTKPVEEIERVLAQRFEQSGVDLPAEEVAELARQISTGDAAGPE